MEWPVGPAGPLNSKTSLLGGSSQDLSDVRITPIYKPFSWPCKEGEQHNPILKGDNNDHHGFFSQAKNILRFSQLSFLLCDQCAFWFTRFASQQKSLFGSGPLPRMQSSQPGWHYMFTTCLVGNTYKPLFATGILGGGGVDLNLCPRNEQNLSMKRGHHCNLTCRTCHPHVPTEPPMMVLNTETLSLTFKICQYTNVFFSRMNVLKRIGIFWTKEELSPCKHGVSMRDIQLQHFGLTKGGGRWIGTTQEEVPTQSGMGDTDVDCWIARRCWVMRGGVVWGQRFIVYSCILVFYVKKAITSEVKPEGLEEQVIHLETRNVIVSVGLLKRVCFFGGFRVDVENKAHGRA